MGCSTAERATAKLDECMSPLSDHEDTCIDEVPAALSRCAALRRYCMSQQVDDSLSSANREILLKAFEAVSGEVPFFCTLKSTICTVSGSVEPNSGLLSGNVTSFRLGRGGLVCYEATLQKVARVEPSSDRRRCADLTREKDELKRQVDELQKNLQESQGRHRVNTRNLDLAQSGPWKCLTILPCEPCALGQVARR